MQDITMTHNKLGHIKYRHHTTQLPKRSTTALVLQNTHTNSDAVCGIFTIYCVNCVTGYVTLCYVIVCHCMHVVHVQVNTCCIFLLGVEVELKCDCEVLVACIGPIRAHTWEKMCAYRIIDLEQEKVITQYKVCDIQHKSTLVQATTTNKNHL